MEQLPLDMEDVVREMGLRDVAILQLQNQLKTILAIPGVKEAIAKHQSESQSDLVVPRPTLLVPDGANGEPATKQRRVVKDVPQA